MSRYVYTNLIAILFTLVLSLSVTAQQKETGAFMVVKGDIQVQRSKDNKIEKVKVGSKIYPKDTIIAGKDARAKLVMVDKNILNISPDTKLEIQDYTYKPSENNKNVVLNLVYGKVRPQVKEKYDDKNNSFRVKTPSAVAGVRGTDFIVGFANDKSQVITFSGAVAVGSGLDSSGQISNPVAVMPGQMTVSANGSVSTPTAVPAAQLNSIEQESKTETASSDSESTDREPASQPSDEKTDDKKGEPSGEAKPEGPRSPASAGGLLPPPPPPVNEAPVLDVGPSLPPPIAILPPEIPRNDYVNDVIQNGNTKAIINIVAP